MKPYAQLLISLVIVACLINVTLAFSGVNNIEVYFLANAIAYFIITLLYIYPNPKVHKNLNVLKAIIFMSFLVIVVIRIIKII